MQWWACSSFTSPPLPAEAGCESRERIVLLLVVVDQRQHGNKSAKVYFILRQQVFCWMRLLNTHNLAGNAAGQWRTDSTKSRTFILCEKKREWVYSNASISLKNPLLVRVWPMCPSVKLHLSRLLFMQYKITWLVRIHLCRLVEILLNRWGLVLTSEWIQSAKPYLLWRVFTSHLVNFAKPAWCSNCSKFVRSRVNIQVYLIVRFV